MVSKNEKKCYLLLLLLITSHFCFSQIYTKQDFKRVIIPSSCLLISGGFNGSAEYIKFHYNGDSKFWNNSLSWQNKWKNGDPLQGEKFPFSSTALVGLTDGYHMMRSFSNVFMVTGITVKLGEKRKWYKYVIDGVIFYTTYNIGFNIVYETIK